MSSCIDNNNADCTIPLEAIKVLDAIGKTPPKDNQGYPFKGNSSTRGDGGTTSYYELPEGATELSHIIAHKHMEHGIGEAFCALYRLNDNGEYLRNLTKAKYYIEAAIEIYKQRNKG